MQRRAFVIGGGALLAEAAWAVPTSLKAAIAALEVKTGGRIGLAVVDTGSARRFAWRGAERFPMCSTFKALLAAHVLSRVDAGKEKLTRSIPIEQSDLLSHAPFAETRVGRAATIGELCRATVTVSDNAAANLLLASLGGPAGLTHFLRDIGDPTTRLDRIEVDLNEARPGDPRDTSTPVAMAATLGRLLLGNVLTPASRRQLLDWMLACETGKAKLRAGLAPAWTVADKTGAGEHGSDNDIALVMPPGRKPLVVVSYLHGSARSHDQLAPVHARIGALIGTHFA
jgi:beta-lactamase class A